MTQVHVEPPPILLVNVKHNGKPCKYFIKLKLCRNLTLSTSDLYEFKISLFDNGEPEEFLLFLLNFNITLAVSGMLEASTKIQYLCTLVLGGLLCQFDSLSSDM